MNTSQATVHTAADLTGQANHLGVTIQADIIKQKAPDCNGGFKALNFGKSLLEKGESNSDTLRTEITQIINSESQIKIDYVSVTNINSLEEIEGKIEVDILVSLAVFLGDTRLIDNFTYASSSKR